MGFIDAIFGFNKPKKRFDQSQPSTVKLWPFEIKYILKRTYLKTLNDEQKAEIISALESEASNGLTELEFRSVIKSFFFQKKISKTDYRVLENLFRPYYSGEKRVRR